MRCIEGPQHGTAPEADDLKNGAKEDACPLKHFEMELICVFRVLKKGSSVQFVCFLEGVFLLVPGDVVFIDQGFKSH